MTRPPRKTLQRRPHRRGDDIPPVSAYAHYNEDAYAMWYEENRYDMLYADEIVDDPNEDLYDPDDPDYDGEDGR